MGEKRRLGEDEAVEEVVENMPKKKKDKKRSKSDENSDLDEIYSNLTGVNVETEDLRRLVVFLMDCKDNEDARSQLKSKFDFHLLTALMTSYTATRRENDVLIYDALCMMERSCKINLAPMSPLVFGEKSKENYENIKTLGANLHVKLSPDQVLEFLNPSQMWGTLMYANKADDPNFESRYDVRFVLRLLASIMYSGSEISLKKVVESNALSLAISCTSSRDIHTRKMAYYVLQRYVSLMQELRVDTFDQKPLFIYIIRLLKNSIEQEGQHVPNIISTYLARVLKILMNAEDPLFSPCMNFLTMSHTLNLQQVPDLMALLFSTSTENNSKEREFILKVMAEGLMEPNDYAVIQNRGAIKIILSMFSAPLINQYHKSAILNLLKRCANMQSVAHDLIHKMNFHTWIALQFKNPVVTRYERVFLAEILLTLLQNERKNVREGKEMDPAMLLTIKMAIKGVSMDIRVGAAKETDMILADSLMELNDKKWKKKKGT